MQRTFIILSVLVITAQTKSAAQKVVNVLEYIATYKEIAIAEMKRTGVPASIKLAQGIHETEAGKSDLVLKSNNHFGIKCKLTWTGEKVYHDDDSRDECFRSYGRAEESYMDHSDFLKSSPRYSFLFDLDPTDYEGWAFGLKKAGYATNARYSQVLINLIRTYNLQDYSLIALGRMKDSDPMIASNKKLVPILVPSFDTGITEQGVEMLPVPSYSTGQFTINNTKVIYAPANTAWLFLADKYDIPLSRLWDFNDLEKDDDLLLKPQLVFLQRKRKVGSKEFHLMKNGENLYDICQSEGIRYESLMELNHLNGSLLPAPGEKLHLQFAATSPPLVVSKKNNKLDLNTATDKVVFQKALTPASPVQANNSVPDPQMTPEFTTHQVLTKETLYSISKKYGVEVEKLMEWNGLDSMNVKIGQSLLIYKSN